MSIPVIGTAVVTNPFWVTRLLFSVDYPVDNFVIFNNNGRGEITEELDALTKIKHKFVKKVTVCHLPANIGCGGAWNMTIKCYMNAPYWIIVNDDVAFGLGFLEEMISAANSDEEVGIVHGKPGDYQIGSWDLFLIKDWVIAQYGLFDENLYPAYCEDSDYIMRIKNGKVKRVLELNTPYYHGLGTEYYEHGSQTKKSSAELFHKLNIVNETNFEYMNKKWGEGWRWVSPHKNPLGIENMPISYTSYDLNFVRTKHLGF